ncbi:MAG: hypothetical protein Q9163_003025 [Psora crenata]
MPLLKLQPRPLLPTGSRLRVGITTQKPRLLALRPPDRRGTVRRRPPPGPRSQQLKSSNSFPSRPSVPQDKRQSSVDAVSSALHNADAETNNLLSPVHIPEDPEGVLTEKHPATSILANSAIVVTRQLELMNVMMGFEQANKYVIMDPQGQHIGFMAERDLGMGSMFKRQMFSTHRSFTTHVFDRFGKEVLRFHRPFSWISSRIGIYDPLKPEEYAPSSSTAVSPITPGGLTTDINQDAIRVSPLPLSEMRIIGEAQQQWAPLRRKYDLFVHRDTPDPSTPQLTSGDLPLSNSKALQPSTPEAPNSGGQFGQFAYVDEPFLSWDFSLLTSDSKLLGSVNRNFTGFGREIFTDTGVYALRMDSAGLAQQPEHLPSKAGQGAQPAGGPGMTLDQRAVMLATAVSVDFDYFSHKSGGGGMVGGFWPVWLPGGGGGAAGAEAGAEAGAVEGAGSVAQEMRGAVGVPGEGAVAGAGTIAGYEAMQRGAYGDDASPQSGPSAAPPPPPPEQPGQVGEGEKVWGSDDDPWGGPNAGDASNSDGGGGEGGWVDTLSGFFNDS